MHHPDVFTRSDPVLQSLWIYRKSALTLETLLLEARLKFYAYLRLFKKHA